MLFVLVEKQQSSFNCLLKTQNQSNHLKMMKQSVFDVFTYNRRRAWKEACAAIGLGFTSNC